MASVLDTGAAPLEAQRLDRELREGNPTLGWRGDRRLRLVIGVVSAAKTQVKDGKTFRKGDVMGLSLIVMRHNEDGTDTPILQRPITKIHEVIPALIGADPRTPGFENVMDRVERDNEKVEKQKSTEFREAWGEMTEHLWSIADETLHGKTTFRQVGGLRDEKKS